MAAHSPGSNQLLFLSILGPLDLRVGARVLDVGERQQRLMALLALCPGRVVSYNQLIDALWDDPPATARRQVQNSISQLRAMLIRIGAPTAISSASGGYALRVPATQVDWWCFEKLVTTAADRAVSGDHSGAAAGMRDALALWRGPALAGIEGAVIRREADSLNLARLAAHERWAEFELRVGNHQQVIAELTRLVNEHPLRETAVALLMTALQRAGRVADALAAYRCLADALRTDLGVDPSPPLRRLHEEILCADRPSGPQTQPDQIAAPVAGPTPRQLPATARLLIGRETAHRQLDDWLLPGQQKQPPVAVVSGVGGVGKTALAVSWGQAVAAAFPDGQLFVDLRGFATGTPAGPAEALTGFLTALGVPPQRIPATVPAQAALFRTLAAGRRMLIVLDNARDVEQIRPLLPGAGPAVLVTSRNRLPALTALYDAHLLELPVLPRESSVALLAELLGAVATSTAQVHDLAELCGHLPLALRIAAAGVRQTSRGKLDLYLAQLRRDRLGVLSLSEHDEQASVAATLEPSYHALPGPARRLFRLLGAAPGIDISTPAAAALFGTTTDSVRSVLGTLTHANLIEQTGERWAMHDLVSRYALSCCERDEPADTRTAAILRLLDFWLRTAHAALERAWPVGRQCPTAIDPAVVPLRFVAANDAVAWLDGERTNLVAAVRYAADQGPRDWAWTIADELARYLWATRHGTDWLAIATAARAAADSAGDPAAQASMANFTAMAHWAFGDFAKAATHFEQALTINEKLGRTVGQAANLSNLAGLYRANGRLTDGFRCAKRSVLLYRQLDRPSYLVNSELTLAMLYKDAGQLRRALALNSRLRVRYRDLEHADGQASTHVEMSEICSYLGLPAQARNHAAAVLALPSPGAALPNRISASATLARLTQPIDTSLVALANLLQQARDAADAQLEAEVLCAVADAALDAGQYDHAQHHYRLALTVAQEAGEVHRHIDALRGLAATGHLLHPNRDNLATAIAAGELAANHGLRIRHSQCRAVEAQIHNGLGDRTSALRAAQAARRIQRNAGALALLTYTDDLINRSSARLSSPATHPASLRGRSG